jgi:adenine-specific DNA-methyltransferase
VGVNISYMGTKKELAPSVANVIGQASPGILLDAFAGMCSVGEAVGTQRQVWTNDVQVFAAEVGRALFSSSDDPPNVLRTGEAHFDAFDKHRQTLSRACKRSLETEQRLLDSSTSEVFFTNLSRHSRAYAKDVGRMRKGRTNLFTSIYGDSYFGIQQAIDADAITWSVASSSRTGFISPDTERWLKIALGRALLKISNSTGHFAQYLKPKSDSYKRYLAQRRRSLWTEWLYSLGELQPVGTADWRSRNRSFNQDGLSLLPSLKRARERPAVIYADPPYTDDQYSRYYHLLETLILYDYPIASGAGLYRENRFTTPFSLKSKAPRAFEEFVASSKRIGADLVLSYPSNGLLHESGVRPRDILRKYYTNVELCYELPHTHSTFGASKGPASSEVTELIYLAKLC